MNTRCPPKRVPSAARFFTLCRLTMQPPQSYSIGGQRSSGQLTGKPAGARPDYRGRWCAVTRGHSGRPNPPSAWAKLGQLCAAPWELPSTVGCGIAWTQTGDVQAKLPSTVGCGIAWNRTRDVQTIERILHSSEISNYYLSLAHCYHPCADSGVAKTNTRCPPKRVPSADRFFSQCRLTMQPPRSYSVGGQRSSGQLTGKTTGAQSDYRSRWCAVN
ncbi:UNVERIFIED_CONTAM: hypothetical protein FKN15_067063 [Acipenser sinensis]